MPSLLDFVPQSEMVHGVKVYGLGITAIAILISEHPVLAQISMGSGAKYADVLSSAPIAVPAVIAAGCGGLADKDTMAKAESLPIDVQLDFLEAIGRLTFPQGFGPFLERLSTLKGKIAGEFSKVQASKSPKP